jgi:hypothetical protein
LEFALVPETAYSERIHRVIEYVIADAQQLLMGGGVGIRRAHHPVASTSHALRANYLSYPCPTTTTKHRTTAPIYHNLGKALYFNDLRTLAAFVQEGPVQDIALLHKVRFLSIPYVENHAATDWL